MRRTGEPVKGHSPTFRGSNIQTFERPEASPSPGAARALQIILWVLFLGPLAAPLFQATGLPLVADSGALARDLLSRFVCPTPAKSYMLAGFPMAVCARCWGATIGLWAAWFVFRRSAGGRAGARLEAYLARDWTARLGLSALPFWLWVAEIRWWPGAPYWVLLLNGAFAGFWAGLFFCSVWPGVSRARERG